MSIHGPREHHPPVLLTVLPPERRARHPYQFCPMVGLIALSLYQLVFGPVPSAAITALGQGSQNMLNWYALFGGGAGVASAFIPERIVDWHLRRRTYQIDATWIRMWVEVGCHGLVFFVWLSYLITIWNKVPFVQGLTLGSVLAMCLMVAALWRAGQILWQVKRAIIDPPGVSGIISSGELEP